MLCSLQKLKRYNNVPHGTKTSCCSPSQSTHFESSQPLNGLSVIFMHKRDQSASSQELITRSIVQLIVDDITGITDTLTMHTHIKGRGLIIL